MLETEERPAVRRTEDVRSGFCGGIAEGDGLDLPGHSPHFVNVLYVYVEVAEGERAERGAGEEGGPEVAGAWVEAQFDGGERNSAGAEGEDHVHDRVPECVFVVGAVQSHGRDLERGKVEKRQNWQWVVGRGWHDFEVAGVPE